MHMHSCSLFFFLSLLYFCGAVAKLPDSTSWGAFLAKVLQASTCFACLTSFYIYSSAPGFCLCLWNCHKHLCWLLTAQDFSLQVLNLPLCMVEEQAFLCKVVPSVCLSIPGPCCLHYVACVPVILQQSLCSLPLQDVFMNQIVSVILLM